MNPIHPFTCVSLAALLALFHLPANSAYAMGPTPVKETPKRTKPADPCLLKVPRKAIEYRRKVVTRYQEDLVESDTWHVYGSVTPKGLVRGEELNLGHPSVKPVISRLLRQCTNTIRAHFPHTVLSDDGRFLVTTRYSCVPKISPPEPAGCTIGDIPYSNHYDHTCSHRYEISVELQKSIPIYEELNLEQVAERKCELLAACFRKAGTKEKIDWVRDMQVQLGCH